MKVIGTRIVDEVTSEVGEKFFNEMYECTPDDIIKDYELEPFLIDKRVIAVLEYDGEIVHAVHLDAGEIGTVWGEGCHDRPFNTDGMAFLDVESVLGVRRFCYQNSPYELTEDDNEWFDFFIDYEGIGLIQQHFVDEVNALFDTNYSFDQITFVRML
ncbi:hypothetical protein vBPpSSYP_99 [Pseudomonas phage vB_PpS_SYP]|nr:hypothetical protein vBPpSSYP_99 [Pseudomonas phage vB_PpS_SYP]